jgi:L-iditol 2-dehydrogenase
VRIPEAAVRQGNLAILPENISFSEAALAEPLSCVLNAHEKIGVYPGDVVLVIGSGPVGIMHCLMALMKGASRVYISDLSEERMDLACSFDNRIHKLPSDENLFDTLKMETHGRLANLVITAASVGAIQEMAFSLVGVQGRVMFFGGLPTGKSVVKLDTNEIHYKQLLVGGTTRQSLRQYRECIKLIAENVIQVKQIITAKSTVEDVELAINDAKNGIGLKRAIVFS